MCQVPVKRLYNGQVELRDAGEDHTRSNGKIEYLSFSVELQSNFRETGARGSFISYPGFVKRGRNIDEEKKKGESLPSFPPRTNLLVPHHLNA